MSRSCRRNNRSTHVGDLVAPKLELARSVLEIEDGHGVFGGDFSGDGDCTSSRGGNGTAGLVTARG